LVRPLRQSPASTLGDGEDGEGGEADQPGDDQAKALEGVASRRTPPLIPPATAIAIRLLARLCWPASSGREPQTDPALLNTRATVLDTFAVRGGNPTARRAG